MVLCFKFQTEILRIIRNVELLLVPEDTTETAKSLRGFADPRTDLQVRATVFLDDTSQNTGNWRHVQQGDGQGKGGCERVVHKDQLRELPWSWSLNS